MRRRTSAAFLWEEHDILNTLDTLLKPSAKPDVTRINVTSVGFSGPSNNF